MIELIIYFYMLVCLSMIAFNICIICIYYIKDQTSKSYELQFLEHISNNNLYFVLKKYNKKSIIEKTYLFYFLNKYQILNQCDDICIDVIKDMAYQLLHSSPITTKENIMHLFYSFNDEIFIIEALKIIDNSDDYYHDHLLFNGMLHFKDKDKLSDLLILHFNDYSSSMQKVIIEYIIYARLEYNTFVSSLLNDDTNYELLLSSLRYFKYHKYHPIINKLIYYSNHPYWQIQSLAIQALKHYNDQSIKDILINHLNSDSWYVMSSSAKALLDMTFNDDEINKSLGYIHYQYYKSRREYERNLNCM